MTAAGALPGVGGVAIIALAMAAVGCARTNDGSPTTSSERLDPSLSLAGHGTEIARPRYMFSVISGGAYSGAELREAVRADSVVARHYEGIAFDRVRATTVSNPRAVHVSYRVGDQIYWTRRKVMLQPGETIVTDGAFEMRARCGNRISDDPMSPTRAGEPDARDFDLPAGAPGVDADGALAPSALLESANPDGPFGGLPYVPIDGARNPDPPAGAFATNLEPNGPLLFGGPPASRVFTSGGTVTPNPVESGRRIPTGGARHQDPVDDLAERLPSMAAVDPSAWPSPTTAWDAYPPPPLVMPEPATILTVGGGIGVLVVRRLRRRKSRMQR